MSAIESLRRILPTLPEEEATVSRDFGRGYAKAIRDVLGLIEAVEPTRLDPPLTDLTGVSKVSLSSNTDR